MTINSTPIAWAQVCDMRRQLEALIYADWPIGGMTRKEKREIGYALGALERAIDHVLKAQSSLAERSKLQGVSDPDYKNYRKLKDS